MSSLFKSTTSGCLPYLRPLSLNILCCESLVHKSVTAARPSAHCTTDGHVDDDDTVEKIGAEQNLATAVNYGLTSFPREQRFHCTIFHTILPIIMLSGATSLIHSLVPG